jgi:DMSO/TMAO reductase YedYZ molybdopterin-dependent catalytic subunit
MSQKTSRRSFLKQVGAGGLVLAGAGLVGSCEEVIVVAKIDGDVPDFATSAADGVWYYQSGQGTLKPDAPQIAPADWSLSIRADGVELTTLDFATLTSYTPLLLWKAIRCVVIGSEVGTPQILYVANGLFEGVPLADVLADVAVPEGTARVRTIAADGFSSNIPYARVVDPAPGDLPVLLAYALNGEPLSVLRGAPVRVVLPEAWGYKNVKWLSALDLSTSDDAFGKYETELYSPDSNPREVHEGIDRSGRMPLMTLVTKPSSSVGSEVEGPDVEFAGVALSGGARVTSVEVNVDGAGWAPVRLPSELETKATLTRALAGLDPDTIQGAAGQWPYTGSWVTWSHTVTGLAPGEHTIQFRATDDRGNLQADSITAQQRTLEVPAARLIVTVT